MPGTLPHRVVSIDLDDTLWPVAPVIHGAEADLRAWLTRRYPRVIRRFSPHQLRDLRDRINARYPERAHDLSWLRQRTVQEALGIAGYADAEAAAGEALAVFLEARNRVELYADVRPALERLSRDLVLVALTNGNADLARIGLADYFRHDFSASKVGAAKPDPAMFAAVCAATGAEPGEILHVGDDPVRDVVGAARGGMATAWVNRERRVWPREHSRPDFEVDDMAALVRRLGR